MTATIGFFANGYEMVGGSGLAFFGSDGFGASVRVGEYQGRTYISNSNGTTSGPEADNCKFLNSASGILGQTGTGIALRCIPNDQATLEIRSVFDTAVQVQNAELRIYDRYSINNDQSGVTVKGAEIQHPAVTQSNTGSGDTSWQTLRGSGVTLSLCNSPGVSGIYANNSSTHTDTVHSHFVALSVSPDSIGSKSNFGLYVSLEYL